MPNIKYLFILFFLTINLNALMQKDFVYVEDLDSNEISLKDEFFNEKTKFYTISVGTLNLDKHDPIEFFKIHKLRNALAYKFGKNKEFARIISGVYKTGTKATLDIKNLSSDLQRNRPYSAKLVRHQDLYKENRLKNTKKTIKQKELKNSIYSTNEKISQNLKKEFLNPDSKYYSIALGTISLDKSSIQNFFDTYDVGDKALAHVYGKNRDKARIIYGLYKSSSEAKVALKEFNTSLKANLPYSMKMKKFQNFYKKFYPNGLDEKIIVELKVNDKKEEQQISKVKLSDEIKIVKSKDKIEKKRVVQKAFSPKAIKKELKEAPKKIKKQEPKKVVKKIEKKIQQEELNKNRFLKYTKLEDVFYIQSDGNFNILSEVFLNEKSSFYTVDFGELKLDNISVEEYFVKNRMRDDALAYKYGDKNQYARIIYGAFETKDAAEDAIENISFTPAKELRVSNIKNHQTLYKEFHKNTKKVENKNTISYGDKIFIAEDEENKNILEKEFFNRDSNLFTITLLTFLKNDLSPEEFFSRYELSNDVLAYPIGTVNNYYRVIYGLYKSSKEAKKAIENLPNYLRKNQPYISRIKTNQRKFESYNNRNLEDETQRIEKIQFR